MNKDEQKMLVIMQIVYETYDFDWMGTSITEENPLTFHRIVKRKKGESNIGNGALLTKKSQQQLNKLLHRNPEMYSLWQDLLIKINKGNGPISEENIETIEEYKTMMNEDIFQKKLKK